MTGIKPILQDTFGLNNLLLGLPVTKNWGLVLGITPISSLGYDVNSTVR